MEKKRDWLAILLEAVCWIALMGAEFFFILSFLPRKLWWVFLALTLLILLYAVGRRKLWRQKAFLRVSGFVLALVSLVTGWVCFSESSQAFDVFWGTEDPSRYEYVKKRFFPVEDSRLDIFPYSIPEYASEIKFQYFPLPLRGGSDFSLEFRTPQEEVEDWEIFFREKADYPGSYLDQGLTPADMAFFLGYPYECKVYVIYAKNQSENDNPSLENYKWDHGEICLGAVNPITNHVYFYESSW